jgi:hypothetical protein
MKFEFKKIQNMFQIFKKLLPHGNGVLCTWHVKQSCNLWYKKLKPI